MNKVKPRPPVRSLGRVQGLRSSTPASYRSPSPAMLRSPSPAISRVVQPTRKGPTPCEQCGQTSFIEDGGQVICENCGAVSIDTGNFANDVVFGETDSGRTQQIGTRVNEGQTHQRTFMARNQPLGRVGHEAMHTSEKAKLEADATFNKFAMLLGVRQKEKNAASMIFQMAYGNGFVRGRTIESVAIVCLYLATRRAKDAIPPYSLMLIDFAEPANINVFDLGRMMQDMVKRLYLGSDGKLAENESILLRAPGAEVLIEKFVKHLDFGNDEYKIRKDATKILQRMKKDWLHDGRRPSGVCGAAVILAARMNNYRRTLREVVLCAKVTEFTVNKRLEEFKYTDSSKLSVNEFRNDDVREALEATDPPAFYRAGLPAKTKKRGRPKKLALASTAGELEGNEDDEQTGPDESIPGEPSHKRARVDADGFAVPAIPDRTSQPPGTSGLKKRGKPKGAKNWKAPPPTAAEIAFEEEMEHEILQALDTNRELDNPTQINNAIDQVAPDPTPADVTPYRHDVHPRLDPPGPAARSQDGNFGKVNMDPELGDTEFDDDPEVSNCILNEAEKALKERIWVTENAEWLRQENAKKVKRELKNRHLIEQGIDPEDLLRQKGKIIKRKDGARRSGRVGDVEYLKDDFHKQKKSIGGHSGAEIGNEVHEGDNQAGPDAGQAQVAVRKMFNQRGTFSRRINYKNLLDAYQLPSDNSSLSPSRSPSRDREDSVVSAASSTATRRSNGIDWFIENRPGQSRSRGSIAQADRQMRARAERDRNDERRSRRSTRSGSAPEPDASQDEDDNSDDGPKDNATPGTHPEPTTTNTPRQLPTPGPTQRTSRSMTVRQRLGKSRDRSEEPMSDTDSPLSSTYTPQGTGIEANSAANSPGQRSRAQSQRPALSPSRSPERQVGFEIKRQAQAMSEDDIESDEGDYVDEDEDDDNDNNDNEDDGLDAAFEGRYRGPSASRTATATSNASASASVTATATATVTVAAAANKGDDVYEWNDEVVEEG